MPRVDPNKELHRLRGRIDDRINPGAIGRSQGRDPKCQLGKKSATHRQKRALCRVRGLSRTASATLTVEVKCSRSERPLPGFLDQGLGNLRGGPVVARLVGCF